jgi:hypothetical protein
MRIDDQGTIVLFIPETDEEHAWLQTNTQNEEWQWQDRSLVVDHRLAPWLLKAVEEAGFFKLVAS